jgi:sulfur carrier protein ThiS
MTNPRKFQIGVPLATEKKDAMTVADLIDFLETQPKDILVAYSKYSEQCLLGAEELEIVELCEPRPDGWIENRRPDKPFRKYLRFPGN